MMSTVRRFFSKITPLDHIFSTIIAGIIVAFLQIIVSFSLASLLFRGELAPYLAQGAGILLASTALGTALFGILYHQYHIIPSMQSSLTLILASMLGIIVIDPSKDLFTTVLVIMPLIAFMIGSIFFIFGQFRWVKFIRYVPYPVIGGFLAGNGVVLIQGAFGIMTSFDLTWNSIPNLITADQIILWMPGVIIASVLFLVLKRTRRAITIPLVLVVSVIIFYMTIFISRLSITDATTIGLFFGDNIGNISIQPIFTINYDLVDWGAILSQYAKILTMVMVALIHLPLNLTSVEMIKQDDFDIDEQVRSNGIMNLIVSFIGGNAGFSSATTSTLNHRIGGSGRLIYIVASTVIVIVLIFGTSIITRIPLAILGGLLIFIGLEWIDTWIIQGLRKFTRSEYAVAILIMLTVVFVGFLEGVILGTFVMVLVFVGTYSQISIIYRSTSAKKLSSTIERNPHFTDELFNLREKVHVLELTGFLFFGTADTIVSEVRKRLNKTNTPKLEFLIIEFSRVAGVDSSALMSINRVINLADTFNFTVIFANFEDNQSIIRIIEDLSTSDRLEFSSNLDHALEKCENVLLELAGTTQAYISSVLWMQLKDMGMSTKNAKKMKNYLERTHYKPEDVIIKQGDPADRMYFVEIGQVSIYLNFDASNATRLRSVEMGSVVGEIGFFLEQPRSATVIADTDTFIWTFTKASLHQMKDENPELAFEFKDMILRVVAKRLVNNNNLLDVLR